MAIMEVGDLVDQDSRTMEALRFRADQIMAEAGAHKALESQEGQLGVGDLVSVSQLCEVLFSINGHTEVCHIAYTEYLDTLPETPAEDRTPGDTINPCKGLCRNGEAGMILERLAGE